MAFENLNTQFSAPGAELAKSPGDYIDAILKRAQASQAYGKGAESTMIANLLNQAFGGGTIPSQVQSGVSQPVISGASQNIPIVSGPSEEGTSSTVPSSSGSSKAKSILQALGYIKETPGEQMSREIETDYQKKLGEHEAKKIGDLEDSALGGEQSQMTYERASSIMNNPAWKNMRDFSLAPGLQLEYYKRAGSPDQQRMIGDFIGTTNQFILDSIKKFPQRFTNKDMSFMQTMKISPKDSFSVAQGKLESAWMYDKLMSETARRASEIAKKTRMPVDKAWHEARRQLDVDGIQRKIRNNVYKNSTRRFKNKKTGEEISEAEAIEKGII